MSSARMVRGTKSRFVLYICAALVFCGLTFLFHNNQTQLDEVKRANAACTQQQESLSAQLQVIFEYKLRLEKSLQKEKAEHKETKEECQNRAVEEKQQRDKESLEALNKYNALQQHYKLLQSTHKDLTEECGKVRKSQLDAVEEVSKLENKVSSLRQELVQLKEENNKTVETFKMQYQTLLQEKADLEKENMKLKENTEPVSDRVNRLEMTNKQLEKELSQMKIALDQCKASTQSVKAYSSAEFKGKQSGLDGGPAQDNPNNVAVVAAEPPKVVLTGSSTTPVINPDAVMDHDDPLKQGQKEGLSKSSTSPSLLVPNKATQEAAAPLVVPDQSIGGLMMEGQPMHQLDNSHQLAPPDSMQLVQQKPMNPVGPMNPVQEDPGKLFVPAVDINGNKMSMENNINKLMEPRDMNGAVEEMEDPQQGKDNEIPRPVRPHEYQGGDYDKEEDDEGEQMDYDGKQPAQQQQPMPQNHNPPPQSHHSHRQNGGGIMVNPK